MQNTGSPDLRSFALPCNTILTLAEKAAAGHGLPAVPAVMFRRQYDMQIPLPIILENENGRMWLDKHYVAVQLRGGDIQYLYVTRQHIHEEYHGYQVARLMRKIKVYVPQEIRQAFTAATRKMNAARKNNWVFEKKSRQCTKVYIPKW